VNKTKGLENFMEEDEDEREVGHGYDRSDLPN
jgi:hypothetical protein